MSNKRIKIGYFESSYIYSGAESSLFSLVQNIDVDLYEPIIIFVYPQKHQNRYNGLTCKKYYLSEKIVWWMGGARWKKPIKGSGFIKRLIIAYKLAIFAKKNKIDIIHINLMRKDTVMMVLFLKLFHIKIVAHIRSISWKWIPSKFVLNKCDAAICVSECVAERVKKKGGKIQLFPIYDPVEFSEYDIKVSKSEALKILGYDDKQKLISSVGLLSPHKGHDMAIKVFSRIHESNDDYLLLIAGGGDDEEYKRLKSIAEKLQVNKSVIFTNKQIDNIEHVYKASDLIFSLTNEGEAFGRVPFESIACGTPVIAPDMCAAGELIKNNINGFLVNPNDENEIYETAITIIKNEEQTKKIIKEGQKYFSEYLSSKCSAKKVQKVYEKLMG